jgi:hypothetical protein
MNHTDFTIHPFEGVGAVRFGMTPQQVHEIWGEPDSTYRKENSFAGMTPERTQELWAELNDVDCQENSLPSSLFYSHIDYYTKMGIHIDYDELGMCEHISLLSHINDNDKWNTKATSEEDSEELPEDTFQHTDTDDELGIFVDDKIGHKMDYESSGTLVETHDEDSDYTISPTFQGRELYGQTMGEFKDWLKSLDTAIQHTDCGFIFVKFGIGIYSQYYYVPLQDLNCLVETVTVSSIKYTGLWVEGYLTDGYPREEPLVAS